MKDAAEGRTAGLVIGLCGLRFKFGGILWFRGVFRFCFFGEEGRTEKT